MGMADFGERASAVTDEDLADILAARRLFDGPSETHCVDCDEEIPERRRALGGVSRCVSCQEIHEARGNRHD